MPVDSDRSETLDPHPISVDEAAAAYPGRWILLQVTAVDEYDVASHGIVVATGPTRESIQPKVMEVFTSPGGARLRHLVFTGYRRIRSREEWSELLEGIIQTEASGGRQRTRD